MTDDKRLEEKLEAFSARARRVAPACDNEEQTKVSLINPYLEILGYDVRDPLVCRLEYRADFGQGREKVDYAIMRDGRPSILIEAKPATEDFSSAVQVPAQLQRYFMAENAEFAVLTNGLGWQWYRAGPDGKLLETPFLVHDVRSPGSAELRWLQSVSEPQFDPENARAQAEDASIASAVLNWIEETRHRPGTPRSRRLCLEDSSSGIGNWAMLPPNGSSGCAEASSPRLKPTWIARPTASSPPRETSSVKTRDQQARKRKPLPRKTRSLLSWT